MNIIVDFIFYIFEYLNIKLNILYLNNLLTILFFPRSGIESQLVYSEYIATCSLPEINGHLRRYLSTYFLLNTVCAILL